eukprot:10174-Heterococcus_DN1.PRE.5
MTYGEQINTMCKNGATSTHWLEMTLVAPVVQQHSLMLSCPGLDIEQPLAASKLSLTIECLRNVQH